MLKINRNCIIAVHEKIHCLLFKQSSRFVFILAFACTSHLAYAQKKSVSIQFNPVYDSLPLELGKKYPYKNDSIEIATLRFYISGIQFYYNDVLVDEVAKKYHLIDLENPQSLIVHHSDIKNKKFNRIHFSIGVDSITNVSDRKSVV